MLKCVKCIAGVGIPYSPEKESVRNGAAVGVGGKTCAVKSAEAVAAVAASGESRAW